MGRGHRLATGIQLVQEKVDNLFQEMFDAVAKMPPVVIQAAGETQATENRNKAMWG